MIFIFLILLITATILYFNNPKDESTRWAVFFMLCGSFGSLAVVLSYNIRPAMVRYHLYVHDIDTILYFVQIYSSFINQIGFPYGVVMFSIVSSGLVRKKMKNMLAYVLLIPAVITVFITPMISIIAVNYNWMLVWTAPYLLGCCFLLVYSYIKETNRSLKLNRLRTAIIIIPTVISILVFNYVGKAFVSGIPLFRYISMFVGFSFFMFIVFAFIDGALGVKLKFEKHRLDSTLRAMTTGASFLNHTIKGEAGKINILAERIKMVAAANGQEEINNHIMTVIDSAEHLLSMAERIQHQLQDIRMEEQPEFLEQIMEDSLRTVEPLLLEKRISVIKDVRCQVQLVCDKVHLQEVFNNIFANAIEAMKEGGRIYISIYILKKHVVMEIKDTGHGIDKEDMPHIIEPFYSTKKQKSNFGLGLTYCYNVIQKHGGSIEIDSEPNVGTTITLQFPHKKIISKSYVPYDGVNTYGQDQSVFS